MTVQDLFAKIEAYRRRQAAFNILAALIDAYDVQQEPANYNVLMDALIEQRGGHKSNYSEAVKELEADGLVERLIKIDGVYEEAAKYRKGPRYYKEGIGLLNQEVVLTPSPRVLAAFGREPKFFA